MDGMPDTVEVGRIPHIAWAGYDPVTSTYYVIQVDTNGKVQITSATLTTILEEIQNSTYGLEALKDLLVTAQADLDNPSQYKADVSALALEATVAALNDLAQSDILSDATPFDGASIALIKTETDKIAALVTESGSHPTLAEIEASTVLALEATLGTLNTDMKADFDRHLTRWDIWSENVSVVQIPATADQDINLPDVVVPALPTGATIFKVYLLFKCSIIRDTSGSDNGIDEAGTIEIKKSGDSWDAGDSEQLTAYVILDNAWTVDVTNVGRDRGGDAFIGKTDISDAVDGADTYNLRLESVSADGTNLELHDVAVGLRVIFY